jgi:hypothetical protein
MTTTFKYEMEVAAYLEAYVCMLEAYVLHA